MQSTLAEPNAFSLSVEGPENQLLIGDTAMQLSHNSALPFHDDFAKDVKEQKVEGALTLHNWF